MLVDARESRWVDKSGHSWAYLRVEWTVEQKVEKTEKLKAELWVPRTAGKRVVRWDEKSVGSKAGKLGTSDHKVSRSQSLSECD